MSEKHNIPEPNSLDSMEGVGQIEKLEEESFFEEFFLSKELEQSVIKATKDHEIVRLKQFGAIKITEPERMGQSPSPQIHRVVDSFNEVYKPGIDPEFDSVVERFKGQILIDIGAGELSEAYKFAKQLGASVYIAIEPYYASRLIKNIEETQKETGINLPFVVIESDALSFLRNLQNNSANMMIVATDHHMFPDLNYNGMVNQEISRIIEGTHASIEFDSVIGSAHDPDVKKFRIGKEYGEYSTSTEYDERFSPGLYITSGKMSKN